MRRSGPRSKLGFDRPGRHVRPVNRVQSEVEVGEVAPETVPKDHSYGPVSTSFQKGTAGWMERQVGFRPIHDKLVGIQP